MNTTNNILSLDSKEAIEFFLETEQYHGFELPEYFVFDDLLKFIKEAIADTPYEECLAKDVSPENLPNVNLDILLNKDGHYAVRPIILANPFLYYFLVREICNEQSWTIVKNLFEKFKVPTITSCALPIIRNKKKEKFHGATAIFNWWNSMEQRSIELSLEYHYMFVTDITNCYGSVNPQAFDWAFMLKGTQYETNTKSDISKNIQKYLRALQQGRNIGIPQGSAIFDFVAEIILGYADLLLYEAIKKANIKDESYRIIRYRDDYHIFCNDKAKLEEISYILQHILENLNFRMNCKKTKISESIVTDSVKPDKLAYIYNTPIFNKDGCDFDSFEKYLLYILMFARQYPDCGSIKTLLSDIDKRLEEWFKRKERRWQTVDLGIDDDTEESEDISNNPKECDSSYHLPGGSIRAMSAVCAQIALENVGCCHYALRVLSRIVDSLNDEKEKSAIIRLVYSKLCNQPNSDYNQLWLQNITYQQDKIDGTSPYQMRLCRVVVGDKDVELWNNQWVRNDLLSGLPIKGIVNDEVLKKVTPVITFRETRMYNELYEQTFSEQ